jgi:hypothetical protein
MHVSVPGQFPHFFKLEGKTTEVFELFASRNLGFKLRFILDAQLGYLFPLKTFVNDRFFLYEASGFRHLGHSEKPEIRVKKANLDEANILGDDLGAHKYFLLNGTLMVGELPFLRELKDARLFTSAEVVYYPAYKSEASIKDDCRGTIAAGICIPLSEMLHIKIYKDLINVGARYGDVKNTAWVSITFGLF